MKTTATLNPHKLLSIIAPAREPFPETQVHIHNADMKSLGAKNLFRIYMSGVRKVTVEMEDSSELDCLLVPFNGSVWLQLGKTWKDKIA